MASNESPPIGLSATESPSDYGVTIIPESEPHSVKAGEIGARAIVQCHELSKRFGDFEALTECSVRVQRGHIHGLLGPNGAGKSTLIRTMLGFLKPTSGSAEIDGADPTIDDVAVRRRVAYLPGDARLPRHMKGEGVLRFFAEIHPDGDLRRSLEVAKRLELDLRRRVAFMSTGMRQKAALAVVFGPRTPLLILDEPTANLDPTVRGEVLKLILETRRDGQSVLFSSHVLSEIEKTCDRVSFLRRGRLVRELAMEDLFQRHRITALADGELSPPPPDLATQIQIERTPLADGPESVQIDTAGDLAPMLSWVSSLPLSRIRIEPLGLQAIYDDVHLGKASSQEVQT